jgi:TolB-like protein
VVFAVLSERLTIFLIFPGPARVNLHAVGCRSGRRIVRFQFEDCVLDTNRRELLRGRDVVPVEPQVFDLLVFLIRSRDHVVSKDDLLAAVWEGRTVSESALATRINAARSAIGDDGRQQRLIKTFSRKGVRFVAAVQQIEERPKGSSLLELVNAPQLQKPCIAVLPFSTISAGLAQDFAAGLFEEITIGLSKFSWLSVRAPSPNSACHRQDVSTGSGLRYLLEGSVRMAGSRVRITARLLDATTESNLWAHRYDGDLDDFFRLQDQITASVVGAIAAKVEQVEIERVKNAPTEALDAYACTLRGMGSLYHWTRGGVSEALRLFQRAIEIDPECATAYGLAAYCYVQRKSYGWFADHRQEAAESVLLARRAAELAKDDAVALTKSAHAIASVGGDIDSGAVFIDQALLLNPHLAAAWYVRGWLKIFLGKPDSAMEDLALALRLSPLDELSFKVSAAIAYAHFFSGRYDDASAAAETVMRVRPTYLTGVRGAAAGHALAGRLDKAQGLLAQMRQINPKLRLSNLHDLLPLCRAADFNRWSDALQRAGLPE